MSELRELYQETILDHNSNPRNFIKLESPDYHAHGKNPLCGDQISIFIKTKDNIISQISFQGSGCAVCKASSSLMTETVQNRSLKEILELFDLFHKMVTSKEDITTYSEQLGKLIVFAGIREYPVRVKCASLAWHTLKAALEKQQGDVSTE